MSDRPRAVRIRKTGPWWCVEVLVLGRHWPCLWRQVGDWQPVTLGPSQWETTDESLARAVAAETVTLEQFKVSGVQMSGAVSAVEHALAAGVVAILVVVGGLDPGLVSLRVLGLIFGLWWVGGVLLMRRQGPL